MIGINMEMPKSRDKCPLFHGGLDCFCKLTIMPLGYIECHEGRDKDCPLIFIEEKEE